MIVQKPAKTGYTKEACEARDIYVTSIAHYTQYALPLGRLFRSLVSCRLLIIRLAIQDAM